MRNRIHELFDNKQEPILSVYFTAGYPAVEDTLTLLGYLEEAGVDMVEIGFPFSDPLADGPVIQQSSQQAIANGMTLPLLLEQLQLLRRHSQLPVVLMGYLNPVLQLGEVQFLERCAAVGVDGLIIPDMPLTYYETHWMQHCRRLGLSNIMLVTPLSSPERIRQLDEASDGFLYLVSSNSTTGKTLDVDAQRDYFAGVASLSLRNPCLVGFGIHDRPSFEAAARHSRGAIIGSAFLQHVKTQGLSQASVGRFVEQLRPLPASAGA